MGIIENKKIKKYNIIQFNLNKTAFIEENLYPTNAVLNFLLIYLFLLTSLSTFCQ